MAYEKTWQFRTNDAFVPVDATSSLTKYTMWYIKAILTGQTGSITGSGLWTMYSSSINTSASATDLWGATYDPSVINRSATSGSWYVLKSPSIPVSTGSTNFYLCVGYSASADVQATLGFCKTPPTCTTSSFPSSSDMWGINGMGGHSANHYWSDTYFNDGYGTAEKFHCGLATDGTFYIVRSRDGSGVHTLGLMFWLPAQTSSADLYPVFTNFGCRSGSQTAHIFDGTYTTTISITATPTTFVARVGGLGGTANITRKWDNSGITTCGIIDCTVQGTAFSNITQLTDVSDGTIWDLPAYCVSYVTTNSYTMRGRLADMGLGMNEANTQGYTTPVSGTVEYVKVGGVWLPTNNAHSL